MFVKDLEKLSIRSLSDIPEGMFIRLLTDDSRQVGRNVLFALTETGHRFLDDAIERNVQILLISAGDERLAEVMNRVSRDCIVLSCDDVNKSYGMIAASMYGHPSHSLYLCGVTGTNGKTTTVHMMYELWKKAGMRAGRIGTLGAVWLDSTGKEYIEKTGYTTPRAPMLQELLARMREDGITHVALEVSSEALALGRVEGCSFSAAVFTNLTEDHLDYHGDIERYYNAKMALLLGTARSGGQLIMHVPEKFDSRTELSARYARRALNDVRAITDKIEIIDEPVVEKVFSQSHFNRINASLALYAAFGDRIDAPDLQKKFIHSFVDMPEVEGRFQVIGPLNYQSQNRRSSKVEKFHTRITGIVDYAHTTDALENILSEVRNQGFDHIICIFGCGGDRDAGKRQPMGRIAAALSDTVIVTDDNPRTEDPALIRKTILSGMYDIDRSSNDTLTAEKGSIKDSSINQVNGSADRQARSELLAKNESLFSRILEISDRRVAIEKAVDLALSVTGNVVIVVCGKGHETVQIIGDVRMPFDDRTVLSEIMYAQSCLLMPPVKQDEAETVTTA